MPFCTKCGNMMGDRDVFCSKCGVRHAPTAGAAAGSSYTPPPPPPPPHCGPFGPGGPFGASGPFAPGRDPLDGLTPRVASLLCYIPTVGWIGAVIVLASRKFRNNNAVRFHAFQGLYLFALWLLNQWVVHPMMRAMPDYVFHVDRLISAIIIGVSIFMMIKANHEEAYVLPVIGELAQRSANEK